MPPLQRLRSLIAANFVLAVMLYLAWFGWVLASGLAETDPNVARANRAPLGAAVLTLYELGLLYLLWKGGTALTLARVGAVLAGVVGLIQNTVVAWLASEFYGAPFPTALHMMLWYVFASHLVFALGGPVAAREPPPADAALRP